MKDVQCPERNEKLNFQFYIFWVIVDFVHNFQVFYRPKVFEKNAVSKDAQCFETDFWVLEFFVRFVVSNILSILYSTIIVNWSGNLIQKSKPENQLGRGIQFKSIHGLGAEPPVGVFRGTELPLTLFFFYSVQNLPYLKKFDSWKLIFHSIQDIAHL